MIPRSDGRQVPSSEHTVGFLDLRLSLENLPLTAHLGAWPMAWALGWSWERTAGWWTTQGRLPRAVGHRHQPRTTAQGTESQLACDLGQGHYPFGSWFPFL